MASSLGFNSVVLSVGRLWHYGEKHCKNFEIVGATTSIVLRDHAVRRFVIHHCDDDIKIISGRVHPLKADLKTVPSPSPIDKSVEIFEVR